MWIARDEELGLFMFFDDKPHKDEESGFWTSDNDDDKIIQLPDDMYPDIKWEDDEPTEFIPVNKSITREYIY